MPSATPQVEGKGSCFSAQLDLSSSGRNLKFLPLTKLPIKKKNQISICTHLPWPEEQKYGLQSVFLPGCAWNIHSASEGQLQETTEEDEEEPAEYGPGFCFHQDPI